MHRATVYNNKSLNSFKYEPLHYEPKHKNVNAYKLVCYYNIPTESDMYLNKKNVLYADQISPHLCTHINLAFVIIRNNTLYVDPLQLNASLAVIELKKKNRDLKVLLSVGGATDEDGFPDMVINHENRKELILFLKLICRVNIVVLLLDLLSLCCIT